jgi:hypothetical protein
MVIDNLVNTKRRLEPLIPCYFSLDLSPGIDKSKMESRTSVKSQN